MRALLAATLVLGLSACLGNVGTAPDRPSDPTKDTFAPSLGIDLATMTKTVNGVYYKDTVVGGGNVLAGVHVVTLAYNLYIPNGQLADTRPTPLLFDLKGAIAGLVEGMSGMREGGVRRMVIPSALAYGALGFPPGVPPNTTVIYDIALVTIEQ